MTEYGKYINLCRNSRIEMKNTLGYISLHYLLTERERKVKFKTSHNSMAITSVLLLTSQGQEHTKVAWHSDYKLWENSGVLNVVV